MALLPFVFYDWKDLLDRSLQDQVGQEFHQPKPQLMPAETSGGCLKGRTRSQRDRNVQLKHLTTQYLESPYEPPANKDDFQVILDVLHFKPEEIQVKVVNKHLVVMAKHDDRWDEHGLVSRQFIRRYKLPQDVDVEHMESKLTIDGILTIVSPKMQPLKDETVRTIQIECTGRPFLHKKQDEPKTLEQSETQKPE